MQSETKKFSWSFSKIGLFGFFLLWIATYQIVNSSTDYNKLLIEISIGLLAFVGIFYSLIFRRDVEKKRDEMISSELDNFYNKSSKILKEIHQQKDKPNQSIIKRKLRILTDDLESISLFVADTDMKKQLMVSAVTLILTIIISFVDLLFPLGVKVFTMIVVFRNFAYISFLVGTYKALELLSTWYWVAEKSK